MERVAERLWRSSAFSTVVTGISLDAETRDTIRIISSVASNWIDIDYPDRVEAEERTLKAPNRFSDEAIVFAINQQMSLLTEESLTNWAGNLSGWRAAAVAVLNPGNIPFVGLRDFLAVVLSGHRYFGTTSSRSPALLHAFVRSLRNAGFASPAEFGSLDHVLSSSDALIASGTDETMASVESRATVYGIPRERMLLRGPRYSVAVLDGRETEDERLGLAEDILLHDGLGCRNVALVWAPADTSPDPYLEAMATFRSSFPAHAEFRSSLKMQLSYLKAVGTPHAFSDDLQFILSKGKPEVMGPLHIRWSEYQSLESVHDWVELNAGHIQVVVASDRIPLGAHDLLERVTPGMAQRPDLQWKQDGADLDSFLRGLR